jgi:hypothetical protein
MGGAAAVSGSAVMAFRARRRRSQMRNEKRERKMAPTETPTPIPALAPVDSEEEEEVVVLFEGVWEGKSEVVEVEVLDDVGVMGKVVVTVMTGVV